MQSSSASYEMSQGHHHHLQQQQQQHFMADDDRCSPLFSLSDHHQKQIPHPHFYSNHHHHLHHPHQQHQGAEPEQQHQLFQDPHHLFQQHHSVDQEQGDPICNPFFPLAFKSDLNQIHTHIDDKGAASTEKRREEDKAMEEDKGEALQPQIEEPFCEPLNLQFLDRKNKRYCTEVEEHPEQEANRKKKLCKTSEPVLPSSPSDHESNKTKTLSGEFRPFGELEAICDAARIAEETMRNPEKTSAGKTQKKKKGSKVMMDCELSSLGGFFEALVKQLLDHQETLQRKFMEAIERMDQERIEREADWRRQEAAKLTEEAAARAHHRALASSRENVIVTYLEKVTGQRITLPSRNRQ